jgi:hypothetical protein
MLFPSAVFYSAIEHSETCAEVASLTALRQVYRDSRDRARIVELECAAFAVLDTPTFDDCIADLDAAIQQRQDRLDTHDADRGDGGEHLSNHDDFFALAVSICRPRRFL